MVFIYIRMISVSIKDLISFVGVYVLLAASAQNKCTALVCSCYVASRGFDCKGEENSTRISSGSNIKKRSSVLEKKDGVLAEEVGFNDELQGQGRDLIGINDGGGGGSDNGRLSGTNGPHTRKSNLKKRGAVDEENQPKTERRKVSWPDAHGKDIAHIQEFESSVSDDGELKGVRNSCVCSIQ